MVHHHYVIIQGDYNEPIQFPLKPWLRQNGSDGTVQPDVIAQNLVLYESCKNCDKVEVRGIIVVGDFPDRVKFAARQISNLKLEYSFEYNFYVVI